jgi:hypothetical protein
MDHRIFRENTWITLKPHRDTDAGFINIDDYEQRIKLALLELENLKAREPDLDVRFYTDHESGFEINTSFGMQTITVRGFPDEVVVEEEEEKGLEADFESYVLLVEMGSEPGAFAVFAPDGEAHGAEGGMGANMSFVGWSNSISANQDPPGLVGQPTFRAGWLNDPAPPVGADYPGTGYIQVKRVDQGGLAYPGQSRNPIEVTRLIADAGVGTYEDIPLPEHWISVEPGPPPYWLCGYTWAISEDHGGPGGGDFSDTRHLFYGLRRYDGTLAQWWPPEFNQLITIERNWNKEGVLVPYWAAFEIWPGDASDDGLEQYYGEHIVPGSFSKITKTTHDTVRMWGLISEWGTYLYPISDVYLEPCSFPYTQWGNRDPLVIDTIKTDHGMDYLLWGVHVADAWQLYAISGLRFWPQGRTTEHIWGWYVGKRKAWTKEEQIASNIDDGPAWPYWTERMDIILQGNEGSVSEWVLNSHTGLYSASQWFYERDSYIIGVLAGGLKYYIRHEEPENYSGAFCDYGIFTKKNTGVNPDTGEVDKDTIEPIYAYAMKTGQTYPYTTSLSSIHLDTAGIIYGMIIDGQHFMTEEFAYLGGDNGMANDINNGDFDIPGARAAVDSDDNPVTAKPRVRVGLKTKFYPDITKNTGE